MMRFDEPEVSPFGRDLRNIATRGLFRGITLSKTVPPDRTTSIFEDDSAAAQESRTSALAMLRFADLGIEDVRRVPEQYTIGGTTRERQKLVFIHRSGAQEVPFELADESVGTETWFQLIGPALYVLRHGRILLFDEIDASLHPRLSARLLELFHDPVTNPHGAQLIFTTHDTSLLNHLNRDEVWLTEKDQNGATSLTALAEFGGDKVRKSLNLERAYLQGRFGAVPELDQAALRRALDLAGDNEP